MVYSDIRYPILFQYSLLLFVHWGPARVCFMFCLKPDKKFFAKSLKPDKKFFAQNLFQNFRDKIIQSAKSKNLTKSKSYKNFSRNSEEILENKLVKNKFPSSGKTPLISVVKWWKTGFFCGFQIFQPETRFPVSICNLARRRNLLGNFIIFEKKKKAFYFYSKNITFP